MIAEPYAPLSDTNDDKVCAMNLVETCVNAHWSFGGAYYDARDECYKASFRRFEGEGRIVALLWPCRAVPVDMNAEPPTSALVLLDSRRTPTLYFVDACFSPDVYGVLGGAR